MTLSALRQGGKRALASALAALERDPDGDTAHALLDAAWREARAQVVGITGPPGVGKSSLCAALVAAWRRDGKSVGVIAVDPSSRASGGALLGDRVRIVHDSADEGSFVRSMAARDRLGGLAAITAAAVVLMRALHDRVIVETVGVGQSETDIASVADTVLLCVQPGSGDSLQYMKAGIAEIPDIALVTKADLGAAALCTLRDLRAALTTTGKATGQASGAGWQVPVLRAANGDEGDLAALIDALKRHLRHLRSGALVPRRLAQADAWLAGAIREAYGREGLKLAEQLASQLAAGEASSPFRRLEALDAALARRFSGQPER
jgi:LAO/AO transport system kinase